MSTTTSDDYDSPWKEALELYFRACIELFFGFAAQEIDWSRGFEFLDKELQQIARDAKLGRRAADKLVKVWRKDGAEIWLLIHIEIQSQYDPEFAVRMYIYHYRIFDRFGMPVTSFAILGDDRPNWRPDHYGYEQWRCRMSFDFPTVKLLDYADELDKLQEQGNPFGIIVAAHLHTQATRGNAQKRADLKWHLTRRLYEQGYRQSEVRQLYHFIDWLMILLPELEAQLDAQIAQYEEQQKMPYITSMERRGIEKGIEQGSLETFKENVITLLEVRLGQLPADLISTIQTLETKEVLRALIREAAITPSIQAFETVLAALIDD